MLDRDLVSQLTQDDDASALARGLNRLFVHDLVLDCDIGVFASEQGVTQRVRFSVDLDVASRRGERLDQIEQVISYDTIVDGIKSLIAGRHINLVETLAEEIAELALKDPRALRVRVRVEKLEKEPGAVGIEIVREASRT